MSINFNFLPPKQLPPKQKRFYSLGEIIERRKNAERNARLVKILTK